MTYSDFEVCPPGTKAKLERMREALEEIVAGTNMESGEMMAIARAALEDTP